MIADFADFCLWTCVVVDGLRQQIGPLFRYLEPTPCISDSEDLHLALVGESQGWAMETELLAHWRELRDIFPYPPSQNRLNRRCRGLRSTFNLVRGAALGLLDPAGDPLMVISPLSVPIIPFHLVPPSPSAATWNREGAEFGKVPTTKPVTPSYKLDALVTLSGLIADFELTPANARDQVGGVELLATHRDHYVLGDKGYVSSPLAIVVHEECGGGLHSLSITNQSHQISAGDRQLDNDLRQIVVAVTGHFANRFRREVNRAHTLTWLCTVLLGKLAAPTACIYIIRDFSSSSFLQIKELAFTR